MSGYASKADYYRILSNIDDPRFEFKWFNNKARLRRATPYAPEIKQGPFLEMVTTLYLLQGKGVSTPSAMQIAERSGYAPSTITSQLNRKESSTLIGRESEQTYRLLVNGKDVIWVENRNRTGRLTTLQKDTIRMDLRQETRVALVSFI